jgi:hypothetical protein
MVTPVVDVAVDVAGVVETWCLFFLQPHPPHPQRLGQLLFRRHPQSPSLSTTLTLATA